MKKFVIFLILIFSLQTFAQNDFGSIRGVVIDEFGAIFSKAEVKVTPVIEGKLIEKKSLVTIGDNVGEFKFDNLPIGLYEVED